MAEGDRHIQCKSGRVYVVPKGSTPDEVCLVHNESEYEFIDTRVEVWMDLAFREHFYISAYALEIDCANALSLPLPDGVYIPAWISEIAEKVFKAGWKHESTKETP